MNAPSRLIPCPLKEAAAKYPQEPAIIWSSRTISWKKLDQYVDASVRELKKRGVQSASRVAIVDENGPEYIIVLLALWRMNAVACPLSSHLPEMALVEIVQKIKAVMVLSAMPQPLSLVKIRVPKVRLEEVIRFDARELVNDQAKEQRVDLEQEATIILTSGSSGEGKAAMLTYGNHYFNARGSNDVILLKPGDRWLLTLPLYHVAGIGVLFRALLAGAAIVISDGKKELWKQIEDMKVTHVSLVSTQLYRLLNTVGTWHAVSLRAVLLGGSAIPKNLIKQALAAKLPVYLSYGLTEMASQVATGKVRNPDDPCVCVLPHRQLKISADGEILVRGKTLFKGYIQAQKISKILTNDGWFATGDLGMLDAQGNLTVTGRRDNMFISGGENIQPEEIERCLGQMEEIEDAVVVPMADQEFGKRPVAFVKFQNENMVAPVLAMIKHLEQFLPRFKIPVEFYAWPEDIQGAEIKLNRKYFAESKKIKKTILR